MPLKVSRVDVWAASIKDKPGGLAAKLVALADAGVNLEFVISRRTPEKGAGIGVVFVTPIRGARQLRAARATGFSKTGSLHSVRIEGPDRPGIGAKLAEDLAAQGINLRGLSAAAVKGKFVCYLALDSAADAADALRALKRL